MCGIGGIRRFGETPIMQSQVNSLLCSLENRGIDAAGVALVIENKLYIHKDDSPASFFVTTDEYQDFLKEYLPAAWLALVHTRWATKGNPRDGENNHPLYAGRGAVIHNGCLNNDDELFRDLKLERKAAVDSDILRAIIDAHGIEQKAIRTLARVRGSIAAAAFTPKSPGKVLLLRSESPLVLADDGDFLMWASTKEALHLAMRRWEQRHGFWMRPNRSNVFFVPMHNDTAVLIGPNGKEWHQEFRSAQYKRIEPAYRIHDGYLERQKRWNTEVDRKEEKGTSSATTFQWDRGALVLPADKKKADFVMCGKCHRLHELGVSQRDNPLWWYKCRSCGEPFAARPASEGDGH